MAHWIGERPPKGACFQLSSAPSSLGPSGDGRTHAPGAAAALSSFSRGVGGLRSPVAAVCIFSFVELASCVVWKMSGERRLAPFLRCSDEDSDLFITIVACVTITASGDSAAPVAASATTAAEPPPFPSSRRSSARPPGSLTFTWAQLIIGGTAGRRTRSSQG